LSEQVASTIDNEGTEISKGNEVIVVLSRNIKTEVSSGAERAPVSDTNKARGGVNVSRKRLKRISLNSLLKKTGNSTILRGRKQKKSLVLSPKTQRETRHEDRNQRIRHFYEKYILSELKNTWKRVCVSISDLELRLYIILISVLNTLISIIKVIIKNLCFSCQSDPLCLYYINEKK